MAAAAKPEPAQMIRAIDIYLRHAYGDTVPLTVGSQMAVLHAWKGAFYDAPVFAQDDYKSPTRYSMRLGNRHYPHMKLALQLSPDGKTFLLKADAHDRHICPPADSAEFPKFRELMEHNQQLVEAIEKEWAQEGLPTFKAFLREDIARRKAKQ